MWNTFTYKTFSICVKCGTNLLTNLNVFFHICFFFFFSSTSMSIILWQIFSFGSIHPLQPMSDSLSHFLFISHTHTHSLSLSLSISHSSLSFTLLSISPSNPLYLSYSLPPILSPSIFPSLSLRVCVGVGVGVGVFVILFAWLVNEIISRINCNLSVSR